MVAHAGLCRRAQRWPVPTSDGGQFDHSLRAQGGRALLPRSMLLGNRLFGQHSDETHPLRRYAAATRRRGADCGIRLPPDLGTSSPTVVSAAKGGSFEWISDTRRNLALRPLSWRRRGHELGRIAWALIQPRAITIDGDRVAYRVAGKGPVLLLVHGMAGSSRDVEARHAGAGRAVHGRWPPICSGRGSPTSPAATTRSAPMPTRCATCWTPSGTSGPPSSASRSGAAWPCSSPISSRSAASAWSW